MKKLKYKKAMLSAITYVIVPEPKQFFALASVIFIWLMFNLLKL